MEIYIDIVEILLKLTKEELEGFEWYLKNFKRLAFACQCRRKEGEKDKLIFNTLLKEVIDKEISKAENLLDKHDSRWVYIYSYKNDEELKSAKEFIKIIKYFNEKKINMELFLYADEPQYRFTNDEIKTRESINDIVKHIKDNYDKHNMLEQAVAQMILNGITYVHYAPQKRNLVFKYKDKNDLTWEYSFTESEIKKCPKTLSNNKFLFAKSVVEKAFRTGFSLHGGTVILNSLLIDVNVLSKYELFLEDIKKYQPDAMGYEQSVQDSIERIELLKNTLETLKKELEENQFVNIDVASLENITILDVPGEDDLETIVKVKKLYSKDN